MKFILDNWMLITVALTSGALLIWPVIRSSTGGKLSATEAVTLINREKAVVVDVCEADEYAKGHIQGARHIPLAKLATELPQSVKNKDLPLIFVCQSGSRAGSAVRIAQGLGYAKSQALAGGLGSWTAANLPLVKV